MTLAEELKARGLVEHASDDIEKILSKTRTAYFGIDPSADSAQVGNLAAILLVKRLQNAGHKAIFLVGGVTGMIGDPREKGERSLLDAAMIAKNTRALKNQLRSILGRWSVTLVDNASWLGRMELVPFLRNVAKHFTVNDLIKRDIIKRRLETPDESISVTEFVYSLLQGYDYYVLHKKYGVDLQVGGTDQWTNILSGVELVRKKAGDEVYAFTLPIITDSTGKKFGKSEGNAIWLDPDKTSPFQFYQFWLNTPDDSVERYLKIYTFMPLADIELLMAKHHAAPQDREAQETLARLVTEIVHGPAAVAMAAAATDALFGDTPFANLSREARAAALAEAPSVTLARSEVEHGVALTEVLVKGGFASSKSEARRLIEGRGIVLGDMTIENVDQDIHVSDFRDGYTLIRKGKQGVLVLVLK